MNREGELRKKTDELQDKISDLVQQFIKENGNFDVEISGHTVYECNITNPRLHLVTSGVKVNLKV